MKIGKCSGCGREGVMWWKGGEEHKLIGKHRLRGFGGGYNCCNKRCYLIARGVIEGIITQKTLFNGW